MSARSDDGLVHIPVYEPERHVGGETLRLGLTECGEFFTWKTWEPFFGTSHHERRYIPLFIAPTCLACIWEEKHG